MATQFSFPNKMAGESFSLPTEAQKFVDEKLAAMNAVIDSDSSREERKAAMRKFHKEVRWTTQWDEKDGITIPTAILTIL